MTANRRALAKIGLSVIAVIFPASAAFADNIYVDAAGVGINDSTPDATLDVTRTQTNLSNSNGAALVENQKTVSTSGTYVNKGLNVKQSVQINASRTDSGAATGAAISSLRDTSTDVGALTSLNGLEVRFGHHSSLGTASPTTTNAFGVYIEPNHSKGTITNSYALFLADPSSGGTVSNQWAIYQDGQNQLNRFDGKVQLNNLNDPPSSVHLCHNTTTNTIVGCSSSLQFKTNVGNYDGGLDIIRRLHPVVSDWKDGQGTEIGLIAEDVYKVEPALCSFRNGQAFDVSSEAVTATLVNSIKEQQSQIERLEDEIEQLKAMILKN